MRATAFVIAIVLGLIPSVISAATVVSFDVKDIFGVDLSESNHYGSPVPPWKKGNKPGWYYGPNPSSHPHLPSLGGTICKILDKIPDAIHCPHFHPHPPQHSTSKYPNHPHTTSKHTKPPHHTHTHTWSTPPSHTSQQPPPPANTTSSPPPPPPPSDGYNQTFSNITAAVQADDYMTFGLVETTKDCKAMCNANLGCQFVNTYHDVNGKDGSPLLTCALFKLCHGPEAADNRGGQTQPDGSVDYIAESDGWCKA